MLHTLFHWRPGRDTLIATAAGLVAVGLSVAMIPLERWPLASILARDVGQILLVGTVFPLAYILRSNNSFADFGLRLAKWPLFLAINIILAGLLLYQLRRVAPPGDFYWDAAAT